MVDLMFQFHHPGTVPPSIEQVQQEWKLAPEDVDRGYGVVAVDPHAGLYVVLVKPDAAPQLERELAARGPHDPAIGLFGNPPQEPQGDSPHRP